MTDTTINTEEVEKFGRLADEWWDPKGKFKPIHKFNPVRLAYIRELALSHFGKDGSARRPLQGLRVLDIGCGGGLLCEPLARLGAALQPDAAPARPRSWHRLRSADRAPGRCD